MPYRIFLHAGQVTDRIDTYESAATLSADADAAIEVAKALGVDVATVTVEHRDALPQIAVMIPPTPQPAPEPKPITPLEIIANAILSDAGTSQVLKDAARAAIVAGGEVVSDKIVPMVPQKG